MQAKTDHKIPTGGAVVSNDMLDGLSLNQLNDVCSAAFPNLTHTVIWFGQKRENTRISAELKRYARDAFEIGWRYSNGNVIPPVGQKFDAKGNPLYGA